jgi:hypothetical protein
MTFFLDGDSYSVTNISSSSPRLNAATLSEIESSSAMAHKQSRHKTRSVRKPTSAIKARKQVEAFGEEFQTMASTA